MQAVFDAIGAFFTYLLDTITYFAAWIADVFLQVFTDVWELVTDVPVWVFDQILGLVAALVSAIPAPEWTLTFGALPGELLNIAGLIGLGYCLGIIATALAIRLTMQLIPFVRLGS